MKLTTHWILALLVLLQSCLPAHGMTTQEKKTLEDLSAFASECNVYAAQCADKVELYEKYRTTANSVIENQAARTVQLKDQLASEKRKNNVLIPLLGIAVGFLGGAYLIRR